MYAVPELTKLFNNVTIHLARLWCDFDPVESKQSANETLLGHALIPQAIIIKRPTLELPTLELNTHEIVELLEGRDFDTLKLIADECLASEAKEVKLESDELEYTVTLNMLTTYNDRLSEHCNVENVSTLKLSPEHQLAATFFHHTACMIAVNHGVVDDENHNALEYLNKEIAKERVMNPSLDLNERLLDVEQLWTVKDVHTPLIKISVLELVDAAMGNFSDRLMVELSAIAKDIPEETVLYESVGKILTVSITAKVINALQHRINKDKSEIK